MKQIIHLPVKTSIILKLHRMTIIIQLKANTYPLYPSAFDFSSNIHNLLKCYLLYQATSATASPKYVKSQLFPQKVAVFEYMLYC